MEKLYYIETADGRLIVDQDYINNKYNPDTDHIIMIGTKDELKNHIEWLYNI